MSITSKTAEASKGEICNNSSTGTITQERSHARDNVVVYSITVTLGKNIERCWIHIDRENNRRAAHMIVRKISSACRLQYRLAKNIKKITQLSGTLLVVVEKRAKVTTMTKALKEPFLFVRMQGRGLIAPTGADWTIPNTR